MKIKSFLNRLNPFRDRTRPTPPAPSNPWPPYAQLTPPDGAETPVMVQPLCSNPPTGVDNPMFLLYMDKYRPFQTIHHLMWVGEEATDALGVLKVIGSYAKAPELDEGEYRRWDSTLAICTKCQAIAWEKELNEYLTANNYPTTVLRALVYNYEA
jgi:hypothetical protein